jgi:hypothetical protein
MFMEQSPAAHFPVDTPDAVQVTVQLRLPAPSWAFAQVPGSTGGMLSGLPLQVLQSAEQASLQQRPSTQKPLAQSLAEPQVVPTSGLQVLSLAQA